MKLIVNIGILLVFSAWLNYEIRKVSRISKKSSDKFWEREAKANQTRSNDISGLDYITLDPDQLPLADSDDSTVNSYRDTIMKLSDKKICNLAGLTNTDLKLLYGVSNLNKLMEYDNNYTILVSMLHKWGERLYANGNITDALTVLEYAVKCHTDVSKTYLLLAQIYVEQDSRERIDSLLHQLPNTKVMNQEQLRSELIKLKNS